MKKRLSEKRDGFNRREWLNKAREMVNFIEKAPTETRLTLRETGAQTKLSAFGILKSALAARPWRVFATPSTMPQPTTP